MECYDDIIINDFSVKDKKRIINILKDRKNQYEHYADESHLRFHNGRHMTVWDIIFSNMENAFENEPGFKCYAVKRCELWEFAVIYKEDINTVYLILKEKRFKELQHDPDPSHYVKIFNSKNFNLHEERYINMSFFEDNIQGQITADYINEDLERMIGEIKDKVKHCVNILFRETPSGINRIKAVVADKNLKILAEKDWSQYINANVDEIADTKIIEAKKAEITIEDTNIPLGLTAKGKEIKEQKKTEQSIMDEKNIKINEEDKKIKQKDDDKNKD